MTVQIPVTLLLFQLPVSAAWDTVDDDSGGWDPVSYLGDLGRVSESNWPTQVLDVLFREYSSQEKSCALSPSPFLSPPFKMKINQGRDLVSTN